jgi:hypothetical protein
MTKWPQTPRQRVVAGILIAASLAVISAAQVDLHRRPASAVKGDKRIWRVVCLNAIGALAYLFLGRQRD